MVELASTYVVQDRSNQEELQRLIIQDRMVTTVMGGVLPEQENPSVFHRVLDIGCGPGGWVIDTAQAYPAMKLFGIDISTTIIEHARKRAEEQQLPKERVEFLVMDALRMLEFPEDFFDLVNFRCGDSFMRQWDWEKVFEEMQRVLKPKGTARIVEVAVEFSSRSAALSEFYALIRRAFMRAGHLFSEDPLGLIDYLPGLLVRSGFQKIESRRQEIEYRIGTATGDAFAQDVIYLTRNLKPWLYRYGCQPKNYEELCQQVIKDMQQPDFVATNTMVTLWAVNPSKSG